MRDGGCPLTAKPLMEQQSRLLIIIFLFHILSTCMAWWIDGWSSDYEVRDWWALVEARFFGKLLVSHWFGLFGGKEMLGFFKTRWELQRFYGISYISIPPFGLHAPQHLRAFLSMWFRLTSIRCADWKGLVSKERSLD